MHVRVALKSSTTEHIICGVCHQVVLELTPIDPPEHEIRSASMTAGPGLRASLPFQTPLRPAPASTIHSNSVMRQYPAYPAPSPSHHMAGFTQLSPLLSRSLDDPFIDRPSGPGFSPAALANMIRAGAFEPGGSSDATATPGRRQRTSITDDSYLDGAIPSSPPAVIHHMGVDLDQTVPDPPFFAAALAGNPPSLHEALQYNPFFEPASRTLVSTAGVVIVKNIPYACTKSEIIAAIGRNSRIVAQPPGTPLYAIHIIMERSTGKTMDCFVELESEAEANSIVSAYQSRCERNRKPRVGERLVEVELSSQQELMEQLFPKAHCIRWDGAVPVLFDSNEAFNTGFRGFVTVEECAMMVKHAETPHRSPFMSRSINRVYESMISLLHKYPWFQTDLISLAERNLLFKTAASLLRVLMRTLTHHTIPAQLTPQLLQELLCAVLVVPFSQRQKAEVVDLAGLYGFGDVVVSLNSLLVGTFSTTWPFEVLDRIAVREEVIEYFGLLLQRGCAPGRFMVRYQSTDFRSVTIKDAADAEWRAVITAVQSSLARPPLSPDATAGAASEQSSTPTVKSHWSADSPSSLLDVSLVEDISKLSVQPTSNLFNRAPGANRPQIAIPLSISPLTSGTPLLNAGLSTSPASPTVTSSDRLRTSQVIYTGNKLSNKQPLGSIPLQARFSRQKLGRSVEPDHGTKRKATASTPGPLADEATSKSQVMDGGIRAGHTHMHPGYSQSPLAFDGPISPSGGGGIRLDPNAGAFYSHGTSAPAVGGVPHRLPNSAGAASDPARGFEELARARGIRVSTPALAKQVRKTQG